MTFILRLFTDDAGRITGVVERVRTRRQERFQGIEALAEVIARMSAGGPEADASSPGAPPRDVASPLHPRNPR